MILRMARQNPRWGYFSIRRELLKPGHTVLATSLRSRGVLAVGWGDGHLPDLPQARQYASDAYVGGVQRSVPRLSAANPFGDF